MFDPGVPEPSVHEVAEVGAELLVPQAAVVTRLVVSVLVT